MRKYITSMFSDDNSVSFARAGASVIILVNLVLCTYLALVKQSVVDIPIQWAGLVALMYGINKFSPAKTPTKGGGI